MNTETTTTETTAPDLDAVVNEIYQATQAEANIAASERALHRLLSDLKSHDLRMGGMTDDEIRALKHEIDSIRLRFMTASSAAGQRGRIAYKEIGGAAVRHGLHVLRHGAK